MANEIRVTYPTGATLYAQVFNSAGLVWYPVGTAFEAYGTGGRDADDYDIAVTEINAPTGQYRGTFPADIAAGTYTTQVCLQAGVNPANQPTDSVLFAAEIKWSGTAEMDVADQVCDEIVEGTLTLRHMLRIMLAALAGETNGGGTVTLNFRDNADSKNRIVATVDAGRNRTAVVLDGT